MRDRRRLHLSGADPVVGGFRRGGVRRGGRQPVRYRSLPMKEAGGLGSEGRSRTHGSTWTLWLHSKYSSFHRPKIEVTYQQSPLSTRRRRLTGAQRSPDPRAVPSVEKEEELAASPVGPLASAEARRRRPLSDGAAPLGAGRRRRLACASRECVREAERGTGWGSDCCAGGDC
jgi:hypothetical protein